MLYTIIFPPALFIDTWVSMHLGLGRSSRDYLGLGCIDGLRIWQRVKAGYAI
jgi:hypothetical protein